VKGRAEISGGGKKPYRQKGTGRARQGTTRAPQWRGGGVAHGPHQRTHNLKMNKKARNAALCAALSRRCEENALTIFDNFELDEIKTKVVKSIFKDFSFDSVLLVTEHKDDKVVRSSRNLPNVKVIPADGLNVYDILKHRNIALTKGAVESVCKRLEK
jgi:large subunit ribosomal protein L4